MLVGGGGGRWIGGIVVVVVVVVVLVVCVFASVGGGVFMICGAFVCRGQCAGDGLVDLAAYEDVSRFVAEGAGFAVGFGGAVGFGHVGSIDWVI